MVRPLNAVSYPSPPRSPYRALFRGASTAYKYRRQIIEAGRSAGRWARNKFKRKPTRHHPKTHNRPGPEGHSALGRNTLKYVRSVKGLRKNEKTVGTLLLRQSWTGRVFPSSGIQNPYDICSIGSLSQHTVSTGLSYDVQPYFGNTAYYDMDPNRKITGSGVLTANTIPLNAPILIRSGVFNVELANLSNNGGYIDLYVCECKQATPSGPVAQWNLSLQANASSQIVWSPPVPGSRVPLQAGYPTSTYPFMKPRDSLTFGKYWKIVESKAVNLAPAASEIINFDLTINRISRLEVLNQLPAGTIYMKGSYVLMMVIRGALVADLTDSGVGSSTFGSVEIAYHVNTQVKLANVLGGTAKTNVTRVVDDMAFNVPGPAQRLINEIDNVVPLVPV